MSSKRWTVPAALLLALAACGDAGEGPLAPAPDDRSGDAVALQPLIANGCEAYEGACDDDSEEPETGGSGSDYSVPGGDSGGGGSTGTSTDADAELASDALRDDFVQDTVTPNCDAPQSPLEKVACGGVEPDSAQDAFIDDILSDLWNQGGECADISLRGRELMHQGLIRFYEHDPIYGTARGYGNPNWGVRIEVGYWWNRYRTTRDPAGRNFRNMLVHEIEHAMGRAHVPGTEPPATAHETSCAS